MNKNCYRIIFNKARGLMMVVAEITLSQGKASSETVAPSKRHERTLIAAVKPLSFFVWGMLGMVMTSATYAQIVGDPAAAGNQRPSVLTAPNNVPLVNIQTPSAAGVSRNTYSQFDVQQQGAILNNSRTNVQTQLGGWIEGNPSLSNGSARVILNEVNSSNPSFLRGYVEVAGQRAQVVIANPSGVTCDGCGFVNVNRATITTGTPIINNGNLEGFRVQGGLVTIQGNGMDASTTDYTNIIARALQVNAGIWANQLKVVTGANQITIDQTTNDISVSRTTTDTSPAPAFAIDTAQLGGMYAGKITLLATEAGVGVRNAGKLYASVGDVIVTANGQLQNAGQITSSAQAQINTQNDIQNTGSVYAKGNTTITTRGDINNSGTIAATGNTSVAATGATSQITSSNASTLVAGLQADGSVGSTGNLAVNATQSITAQGQNSSGADQTFNAQAINFSGSQISARNLTATASNGDTNLASATVSVGQTLVASATQTLRTDNANVSATQINATAHDLSNVHGTIIQTGSGDLTLNLPGNLNNTQGRIATNGTTMSVTAESLTNTNGRVQHPGTGALTIVAPTVSGARGEITSNGQLQLTASAVTLDAASTTAHQLQITSNSLSNRGGTMTQTGSGASSITANTQLDNSGGQIAANGHTTVTAGALNNQGGTIQAAGASNSTNLNLNLNVTGSLDNSHTGKVLASGNTTITSNSVNNNQGQITAGQALELTTTQAVDNSRGLIAANGQVNLNASQITNQGGTIGSVQDATTITAQTSALDNTAGRIEGAKAVTITAVGLTNTDGTITGKSISANTQTQSFNNTRGKLIASGTALTDTLNVQSGALTNDSGLIQSGSALTINTHGQTLTNTNSGSSSGIVSQSTANLNTGDFNNQAGYLGSSAALIINSAAITNTQSGNIVSGAAATIHGNTLNNQGGQIQALGNVDMGFSGGFNNTGSLVRSGQSLAINAVSIDNTHTTGTNQGLEGNNVALFTRSIDNTVGAIRANNNITMRSSESVNNTNGLISAGNTLAVQDTANLKTLAMTNTSGTFVAGQQLTLDGDSLSGDGSVLSQGNMNVKLQQSVNNTGQIIANGNATFETAATLTNQGTLAAGNTLNAKATTINNQAGASISANNVTLTATDSHTLTNRGTINGAETILETQTLNNLGTGKIYGDHIAIGATTLTNAAENGIAPVIAARNRLDIGANTINNSEHAILFSGGDMAIGGSLDTNKHATGQATTLNNLSATIEALGSADISASTINNINQNFSTKEVVVSSQARDEFQGQGSNQRYNAVDNAIYPTFTRIVENPNAYAFYVRDSLYQWVVGGVRYRNTYRYVYDRSVSETRVASSDSAQILAGGAMRLTADTLLNDKSCIVAGGAITGTIGTLTNTEIAGTRTTTDTGTSYFYITHDPKGGGNDSTEVQITGYAPAATIEAITLTPTVFQQNTASSGSGTQISLLTATAVSQLPTVIKGVDATINAGQVTTSTVKVTALNSSTATGASAVALIGGPMVTPATQVTAPTSNNAKGADTVVRSVNINTSVPNNSLYSVTPKLNAHYLVETDPAFANYRNWISSDYLLNALSINPGLTQKRLGDGFYEQKLIREQVAQLTGKRFLDGYANDEAQYQALMNNSATYAAAHGLVPGISLSAAQMAQLTSDIVWLVEKDITLPNGTTTKALVPQLYVHAQAGDLQSSGALIAGDGVNLNIKGDLTNAGTIAGRQVVALNAENINNLGGRIFGTDVGVKASVDLNNIGGSIAAERNLVASAGRDLNVSSTTRTQTNAQGSQTNIERVAGLYVKGGSGSTSSSGMLLASAGRDMNLIAAAIQNQSGGDTTLAAGRDLNLGTVSQASRDALDWNSKNYRHESTQTDIGTALQTQGNIALQAGRDITARAANITSENGALSLQAVGDITLTTGNAAVQRQEASFFQGRGSWGSKTQSTTRIGLDETNSIATTLSANSINAQAGRDLSVIGSNVVGTNNVALKAGENLNIQAAIDTRNKSQFNETKTSGLFTSGASLTIGTQQQSTDQKNTTTTAAASTIGSTQGAITLQAGKNYTQTGSDIVALKGDIGITAQRVDITEARETSNTQLESKFKQSGLTVAITSPVISAIQTVQQMSKAAGDTTDPRMKALAAANVAFAGNTALGAIKAGQGATIDGKDNQIITKTNPDGSAAETRDATAADKIGGITVSVSIGSSKSQSNTTQTSNNARGSTIMAGNNLTITATGAGANSDITTQGATLQAGNQVSLNAQDQLKLLAATNSADQHSTNSASSGSIGVSMGTGGIGVTLSASRARGNADGSDVTHSNTHVTAGNQVSLTSGGDTTVKGAVVTARQLSANVGGNLQLESLQDTSQYSNKQTSIGGSLTVGASISGSLSASKTNINSDYASVVEQTGFKAGDGGFTVNVAGNTELKGAAITSTQAAIEQRTNSFTTGGTLTTSDLQNRANYQATSVGINIGAGASLDGKLAPEGSGAGIGSASGSASSVTLAAISGIAGNKDARTGDKEAGVQKIFDADKVQKDINAQVQITQTFGREASKAVGDYAAAQRKALQDQIKNAGTPEEKARAEKDIKDVNMQERALNILVAGITGMAGSMVTKEALSAAGEKMRELMIEDSKKFPGVVDSTGTVLNNLSGTSAGVNGDGVKLGGIRVDLDSLCGPASERCAVQKNSDGTKVIDENGKLKLELNAQGQVRFNAEDEKGKPISIADSLKTPEGQKMVGLTGGVQGGKGMLFGMPYQAGSWQDKLIESFSGTHDMIGGKLSGLYDSQGNIKQGMSEFEIKSYAIYSGVAIVPSAPFSAAQSLPTQVWNAISILLGAAR